MCEHVIVKYTLFHQATRSENIVVEVCVKSWCALSDYCNNGVIASFCNRREVVMNDMVTSGNLKLYLDS